MKKITILLVTILISSFAFVNSVKAEETKEWEFKIINNEVYSYYGGKEIKKVEGADPDIFAILSGQFAKNNYQVYVNATEGPYVFTSGHGSDIKIDIESFEAVRGVFAKDKNLLYSISCTSWVGCNLIYYKNIDTATFKFLNDYYAKDKNNVYFFWMTCAAHSCSHDKSILIDADPNTFELVDEFYAKDKSNAYHRANKLKNVDSSTFEIIDKFHAKDKNYVFSRDKILESADPETIKLLEHNYSKDKNHAYFGSKRFNAYVDVKTFVVINEKYSKDKNNVYCNGEVIEDADPNTFKVVLYSYDYYIKDKNNVYLNDGSGILSDDADNFIVLDINYSKDNKNVFYKFKKIIEKADPIAIQKINNFFLKDNKFVFYKDNVIEEVDPQSFEKLFWSFFKDKNHVYLFDSYHQKMTIQENIDPDTFEKISVNYAIDKNKVYYITFDEIQAGEKVDVKTFIPLSMYAKDDNYVCYRNKVMDCSIQAPDIAFTCPDIESFEYIGNDVSNYFAKDKHHYYKNGFIITENYYINKAKEVEVEYKKKQERIRQSINKITQNLDYTSRFDNIYYKDKLLSVSPETFEIIDDNYAKDKYSAYLQGRKIRDGTNIARTKSFEAIKFPYSKDEKSVYYFWDAIPVHVEQSSFQILDNDYSKDNNNIYYKNSVVEDVDVNTFKLNYKDDYQAEDKNNYFNKGKILRAKSGTGTQIPVNNTLLNRLKGKIVLKVEANGEAYYLNPKTNIVSYLGRPADAFQIMREQGLGISENNYNFYNGYASNSLSGMILLRVEANGEAYYVNPDDLKMHYLGRPVDAFNVMRTLGLGISNKNLENILLN